MTFIEFYKKLEKSDLPIINTVSVFDEMTDEDMQYIQNLPRKINGTVVVKIINDKFYVKMQSFDFDSSTMCSTFVFA